MTIRSFRAQFIILVVLFMLLRLATLLTAFEVVHQGEEIHRGTTAHEILQGLKTPLSDYYPENYSVGGFLLMTFITVPLFFLFGKSFLVLKFSAMILSLVTFMLAVLLVRRFFCDRAALIAGWLLLLPPPVLTVLALVGNGDHADSIFLSLLAVFCFFKSLSLSHKNLYLIGGMGLISGISFWFIPTTLIMTLALVISWIGSNAKSFFGKGGVVFLCMFFVGVIPWFFDQALSHANEFSILQETFLGFEGYLKKLFYLLFYGLPLTLFSGIVPKIIGIYLSALYSGIALIVGVFFLFKYIKGEGRQNEEFFKIGFFVIYGLVYVLVCAVSAYEFKYAVDSHASFRYFAPLCFFMLLLLARAFVSLPRNLRVFLLLPLLFLGGLGQANIMFREPFAQAAKYKGYSYWNMGSVWAYSEQHVEGRFLNYLHAQTLFPKENDARFFYWGYLKGSDLNGYTLEHLKEVPKNERSYVLEVWGISLGNEQKWSESGEIASKLSAEEKGYFYRGLAYSKINSGGESPKSLADFFKADSDLEKYFWFEYGTFLFRHHIYFKLDEVKGVSEKLNPENREWFWKGVGRLVVSNCFNQPESKECVRFFLEDFSEYVPLMNWGIGWASCETWLEDPKRAQDHLKQFPEEVLKDGEKGAQACKAWYQIN